MRSLYLMGGGEVEEGRNFNFMKKCILVNILYFNLNMFFKILEWKRLDFLGLEKVKFF